MGIRRLDDVIAGRTRAEVLAQIASGHKLEQQAHGLVDGAHAQQPDDVRMVQFGQQRGLLLEIAAHLVVGLLFQRLDGHDGQRLAFHQIGRFGLMRKSGSQT